MRNLLDLDPQGLTDHFREAGEKPYRARQVMRWVHQLGVRDFTAMSDLARPLRERLATEFEVRLPAVKRDDVAPDGTRKWLLDVGAGNAVEAVLIPEPARLTLCVSSQAGCALECAFCSTGRQGFNRNLAAGEIVAQLWWANRCLADASGQAPGNDFRAVTNVVLMGMGEPLANYDNVVSALRLMLDDRAYGLSRRRVTLSTSGLVSAMDKLREDCPVALAVSLHAPNDSLRDRLVPINRKWPIRDLMAACLRYIERAPRDFVTFEYVMLAGVNDSVEQARELVAAVREVPCKINLIPFNPFADSGFRRSSQDAIARFRDVLLAAGIVTTTRRTRGDVIDAACGQLAGEVADRTRRTARRLAEVRA